MIINSKTSIDGKRVFIAGHLGMVGSALVRRLERAPVEIIVVDRSSVDLCRQQAVEDFISEIKPDCIVVAAGKVGGIHANMQYPASFIYNNLAIVCNLVQAAYINNVERLLYLGSSCIYPRMSLQPIKEEALLTAPLEPTNEWYAIAKISGLKLIEAYRKQYGCSYISAMPTNLYGPEDNFHPENSHVLPALLRRFHEAKVENKDEVVIWGTGSTLREFMHVDDLADALVYLLEHYDQEGHINVGTGTELSILELVKLIKKVVGFKGELTFDVSKPDGMPRKLLDCGRLKSLGWTPSIKLEEGLRSTYQWFCENIDRIRS